MSIPSARAFSNTTFCASDLSEVSDARRRLRTVRECPSRTSPASAKQSIECPLYGCGGKRGALMAQQWGRHGLFRSGAFLAAQLAFAPRVIQLGNAFWFRPCLRLSMRHRLAACRLSGESPPPASTAQVA